MKNYISLGLVCGLLMLTGCANDSPDDLIDPPVVPIVYNGIVRDLFETHCTECHGAKRMESGLSLHTYDAARTGIQLRGVLERMTNPESPMPPSGLLPEEIVNVLVEWSSDESNFPLDPPPPEEEE